MAEQLLSQANRAYHHDHGGFPVSLGARSSVIIDPRRRPGLFHDRGGLAR
jgi:hypothetical protein